MMHSATRAQGTRAVAIMPRYFKGIYILSCFKVRLVHYWIALLSLAADSER